MFELCGLRRLGLRTGIFGRREASHGWVFGIASAGIWAAGWRDVEIRDGDREIEGFWERKGGK